MRVLFVCLVVVLGLVTVGTDASEATSPSWRLASGGVDGGGHEASSPSWSLNGSAAQAATVGASASPSWVLQSGLWGFDGTALVPVWLTVDRSSVTSGNVDLSWSGNNAPYALYESTDCGNVAASPLDTVSVNSYLDVAPPAGALVCYRVFATAPGPAPPPGP